MLPWYAPAGSFTRGDKQCNRGVLLLDDKPSSDFQDYNDEAAQVRDAIADWWDDKIGDGNAVQDLLGPITESCDRHWEVR